MRACRLTCARVWFQEAKKAFKRCQVLSRPQELAQNALQLFDILANSLLVEHIDYGIELALQVRQTRDGVGVPSLDTVLSCPSEQECHHCVK